MNDETPRTPRVRIGRAAADVRLRCGKLVDQRVAHQRPQRWRHSYNSSSSVAAAATRRVHGSATTRRRWCGVRGSEITLQMRDACDVCIGNRLCDDDDDDDARICRARFALCGHDTRQGKGKRGMVEETGMQDEGRAESERSTARSMPVRSVPYMPRPTIERRALSDHLLPCPIPSISPVIHRPPRWARRKCTRGGRSAGRHRRCHRRRRRPACGCVQTVCPSEDGGGTRSGRERADGTGRCGTTGPADTDTDTDGRWMCSDGADAHAHIHTRMQTNSHAHAHTCAIVVVFAAAAAARLIAPP